MRWWKQNLTSFFPFLIYPQTLFADFDESFKSKMFVLKNTNKGQSNIKHEILKKLFLNSNIIVIRTVSDDNLPRGHRRGRAGW